MTDSSLAPQSADLLARQDHCPACGAVDYEIVGPPGAGFAAEAGGRHFWQTDYQARRCRCCSLLFKSAIAALHQLDDYYQRVDFRKWEIPGLYPTERRVLGLLNALPIGSRILDFGCSSGRLLSRLTGSFAVLRGRNQCGSRPDCVRKRHHDTCAPNLYSRQTDAPKFNAITIVDLFEHLSAPTDLLRKLVNQLCPGGRLILCTGDADAPAIRSDPANFWYFRNVEHLCMLNRRHGEYLARELALRLVAWDRESHYDSSSVVRLKQWCQTFAYEVFHRGRSPSLKPALRLVTRVPEGPILGRPPGLDYHARPCGDRV